VIRPYLYRRVRPGVFRHFDQLRREQYYSLSEMVRLRERRLSKLLLHASTNVPYYSRLLRDAGAIGKDGRVCLDRFGDIPVLSRGVVQSDGEQLRSGDLSSRDWYEYASGGSTGQPVVTVQDITCRERAVGIKQLYDSWTGYQAGQRRVLLWGSERDLFVGGETRRTRLARWLKNEVWLNAFRMGPDEMRAHVSVINRVRPRQILAYAEALYELARFAELNGLKVERPGAVMTSAATLLPQMRSTIERVFQTQVFNRYGTREMGDVACECEKHQGLHACDSAYLVEILRPDGSAAAPGEIGELVVTCLFNYAMPLIRYRIGDIGAWAERPCACKRPWRLLSSIAGRVTDVMIRDDGGVVVPEYLIHLVGVVLQASWIRQYQIVQEAMNDVHVRVSTWDSTPRPGAYDAQTSEIRDKLQIVLGPRCQITFDFVDDIEPGPSGKYRYVVSRVARTSPPIAAG
jgi:phenylacetate-coenzyme A ligase PaaK-like adenylate-forming protein